MDRGLDRRERADRGGTDPTASDSDDDARADRRHAAGRAGLGEGADFRAPLGRAVIGGVITSTVLTLLVIPTVYEILDEWRERLLARFGRKARAHLPAAVPEPGD